MILPRPRILHSIPGRIRIRMPKISEPVPVIVPPEDWLKLIKDRDGITHWEYSPHSGNVLITYNPDIISQDDITAAFKRITNAAVKNILKGLPLSSNRRIRAAEKLRDWLLANPVDLKSRAPLEIPDEIWR